MSFVMTYQEVLNENFGQASIYIDACFILSYMDSDDPRGDKVCEILQKWDHEGIHKLGISTHVFGEVLHNLFIQEVLLPLETYHRSQSHRPSASHHNHLPRELHESISFLHSVLKKQIGNFYKKNFSINVSQ
ncbi:hypothetical protein ETC05_07930 [Geobacillus sp. BMUD]|uniref:hypothetical protein n=1 Tax=Geobacillus sp. BMUD TaxID=2508876 RepID=UPI0014915189|nr:hypothetical protein [Geobacillus sp. BMUD]NNU83783.1 hypothetical protein [Geobacillus sp. BMUD]